MSEISNPQPQNARPDEKKLKFSIFRIFFLGKLELENRNWKIGKLAGLIGC